MNAAEFGLHRQPAEVPASLRMAAEILRTVARYLEDEGCPLTPAQAAALEDAQRRIASHAEAVSA